MHLGHVMREEVYVGNSIVDGVTDVVTVQTAAGEGGSIVTLAFIAEPLSALSLVLSKQACDKHNKGED